MDRHRSDDPTRLTIAPLIDRRTLRGRAALAPWTARRVDLDIDGRAHV
jgi:hypothetical protein